MYNVWAVERIRQAVSSGRGKFGIPGGAGVPSVSRSVVRLMGVVGDKRA